ncbi:MAG: peptidylprolyl isomerase [Peptococcaceae bacterium]|nr:peptidylprolyl isomerase [Peptococcaceae bacterium]
MKNRRKNLVLLGVAGMISLIFVLSGCSNEYFVEVNGTKLLVSDLNKKYTMVEKFAVEYYQQEGRDFDEAAKEYIRNCIANDVLIANELIRAEMAANNWKINVPEVDVWIKETKEEMGKNTFRDQLDSLGYTEKELRTIRAHLYHVTESMTVTEEEVREQNKQFGETVKARHILIKAQQEGVDEQDQDPDAKPDEEARAEAQDILDRLNDGEDFETLAKEKSQDEGSKGNGGVYNGIWRGQMVQEFDDTIFSLQPGERSDLVKTIYGYHIIEVMEQNPPKTREQISQEEWDQAEARVKGAKYDEYFIEMIEKADIRFASGYEDLDRYAEPTTPEQQQDPGPDPDSDSGDQESAIETEPLPEEETD